VGQNSTDVDIRAIKEFDAVAKASFFDEELTLTTAAGLTEKRARRLCELTSCFAVRQSRNKAVPLGYVRKHRGKIKGDEEVEERLAC
jgi:hypothetical protein